MGRFAIQAVAVGQYHPPGVGKLVMGAADGDDLEPVALEQAEEFGAAVHGHSKAVSEMVKVR